MEEHPNGVTMPVTVRRVGDAYPAMNIVVPLGTHKDEQWRRMHPRRGFFCLAPRPPTRPVTAKLNYYDE